MELEQVMHLYYKSDYLLLFPSTFGARSFFLNQRNVFSSSCLDTQEPRKESKALEI